ncbi:ATP-binding protein [Stenotrophomonas sp. ATs4]|uniref:ATP-binding protein n=1 Tax=Stenotrophomonas sp. ATs4 TaxID=3402766 RepID=UPI003F6F0060
MSRQVRSRLRTSFALLLVLLLLPAASAEDVRSQHWGPDREVRVATAPFLRPVPAALSEATSLPTLAHGYTGLVARHTRLHFLDLPYPSITASVAAVCHRDADLVLVVRGSAPLQLPCADLVASTPFRGGRTVLAGRPGQWLPRGLPDLEGRTLAVLEGGPYTRWLDAHHPQIDLLRLPDQHAVLAAVIAGTADAAIGVDTTLRPMIHRYFSGELLLQAISSDFSTDLHLLARREDRHLLERIDQGLQDITLEDHASLLHLWAQQMLPASVERVLDRVRSPPPAWLLTVIALLAGLPLLWHPLRRRFGRSERDRARAIGMISHEVRNAAQALLGSIVPLQQAQSPEGRRELLAATTAAGRALRRLLDRSLDFSRLASGGFMPRRQACDVTQLCNQSLDAIRPEAGRKGLKLRLDCDAEPLPLLLLDPDALRQVIDNLLGNALKFTDVGGIDLRLRLQPSTRPHALLLEVIDSGIGIAAAQATSLFQPFQQGEEGQQRGGSGLGLVIARELARSMDGELTVHSVHGRGSRFTLRLPVRIARPDLRRGNTSLQDKPLAGLDLLLVEDHDLNRRLMAAQLERLGADVLALVTAGSALEEQALRPRGTVLLDIGLRDMDGYALAGRLRAQARTPLQLIALSARAGRRHARRCREAGFDAVLAKPLQIERLLQVLGLPEPQQTPPLEGVDCMDSAYVADIGTELAAIERAITDTVADALRHHAHRLQGTLQICGATAQAGTAADLWELGHDAAPDWGDARRLLQALQDWHGSPAQGAMPTA